jgi:hypothetical protein
MNLFTTNDKEALGGDPCCGVLGAGLSRRKVERKHTNAIECIDDADRAAIVKIVGALLSTIICPLCTSENNGAELKSRYLDINSGTQINHISSS